MSNGKNSPNKLGPQYNNGKKTSNKQKSPSKGKTFKSPSPKKQVDGKICLNKCWIIYKISQNLSFYIYQNCLFSRIVHKMFFKGVNPKRNGKRQPKDIIDEEGKKEVDLNNLNNSPKSKKGQSQKQGKMVRVSFKFRMMLY